MREVIHADGKKIGGGFQPPDNSYFGRVILAGSKPVYVLIVSAEESVPDPLTFLLDLAVSG